MLLNVVNSVEDFAEQCCAEKGTVAKQMTKADQRMLGYQEHEPVPCEVFGDMMAERGGCRIGAVKIRRGGPRTTGASPHNDVALATVFVVCSETLVSAWKTA
jgi:hypothetical protein